MSASAPPRSASSGHWRAWQPHERGELFAVAYVIAYLAFSIPALAAGFASTAAGLRSTTLVYGVVVVVLSLAALAAQRALAVRRSGSA